MTARSRPLQPVMWIGLPLIVCMLGVTAFALPIRLWTLQLPEPVFGLAPAFAWAFIRPSVLAPAALLVLGLFQDLMWGTPLGFWSVCLLGLHGLVLVARTSLSGQGFWVLWGWYGSGCAAAFGLGVVLAGLSAGNVPNLLGVAAQWLISVAIYPFAYQLIDRYEDADVRFR